MNEVGQSEQLAELAAALAKAQGAMKNASKSSENPHFRSRYADLAAIFDVARKPLADNGLAVLQRIRTVPEGVSITTQLIHCSGQWVSDTSVWPVAQRTPQGLGSATTYGKRYALSALLGIAAEEDDDGNAASAPGPHQQQRQAARRDKKEPMQGQYGPPAEPPSPTQNPQPEAPNAKLKEEDAGKRHRARCAALWKAAQGKGINSTADFKDWLTMIIARPVASSTELTDGELGLAEQAIKAYGQEPGGAG